MRAAEQAHSSGLAKERTTRALNSRGQRQFNYRPGDLVYHWRKQLPKSLDATKTGGLLGPGRVLVTETHRDEHGNLRAGSSVWIIRGRRLLKCCVEQLRHATTREELMEHLATDTESKAPWTVPRMVKEMGKHEYEDATENQPTDMEWESAEEEAPVPERPLTRHRTKRPVAQVERTDMEIDSQTGPWWSQVNFEENSADAHAYWSDYEAGVEITIDMPTSNRSWTTLEANMAGYFVASMKRRSIEVSEKRMDPETRKLFEGAKGVEVKNFIAAKAFEALPPQLQLPKHKAVGMRWILTRKLKDDGSTKPKARAILLGYQDPDHEHRATTTPVMTNQSRQLLLQAAAIRRWLTQKGDVTGAFLQGREYPTDLYCVPFPEIDEAMGIPSDSITRVKRGCYGLVDAPLEWYRSVSTFLEELGLQKAWSDPCMWLWKRKVPYEASSVAMLMISCSVEVNKTRNGKLC